MQYNVTEVLQGGALISQPFCQVGDCEEKALSVIDSIDGKGKILICGGHLIELDKKQKELNRLITDRALKMLKEEGKW